MQKQNSRILLLFFFPFIIWGALALYFSYLPYFLRVFAAILFLVACLAIFIFVRQRKHAFAMYLSLFFSVLAGWLMMPPSNDRNWQDDVAVLPYATIAGDLITVHNIRDNNYSSEKEYTVHHYDKTFDLKKLSSIDLFLVDWGLKHFVHTMVSFGFGDKDYICISIETRKEKGEDYSMIKGFFRQYELMYVVGDERDLVKLRTNYRENETVYLYRLQDTFQEVKEQVFLDYMKYINRLKVKPEWYNALLSNCTTLIRGHTKPFVNKVTWDWRFLFNGYLDKLAYEFKTIDTSMPFHELKTRSIINHQAKKVHHDPNFSQRIRDGFPGFSELKGPDSKDE